MQVSRKSHKRKMSTATKREMKLLHIAEQHGICPLCLKPMFVLSEIELCHKKSCGMGGSKRDDSMENTFAGHSWCNSAQGSRPFKHGMLAKPIKVVPAKVKQ